MNGLILQQLGISNSAYSLSDQLKLNPIFNDGNSEATFSALEKIISKMRNEWKVIIIK